MRPEAIQLASELYKELKWCKENGIDVSELPVKKQFDELVKEFDLYGQTRRLEVEMALNEARWKF